MKKSLIFTILGFSLLAGVGCQQSQENISQYPPAPPRAVQPREQYVQWRGPGRYHGIWFNTERDYHNWASRRVIHTNRNYTYYYNQPAPHRTYPWYWGWWRRVHPERRPVHHRRVERHHVRRQHERHDRWREWREDQHRRHREHEAERERHRRERESHHHQQRHRR